MSVVVMLAVEQPIVRDVLPGSYRNERAKRYMTRRPIRFVARRDAL